MWNKDHHRVTCESKGRGVRVSNFGGEGTGQKAMKDLAWREGEVVTLVVRGERAQGGWRCSCDVKHRGKTHFMAAYHRTGEQHRPLSSGGFYTFVEDWHRSAKQCEKRFLFHIFLKGCLGLRDI